VAPDAGATVGGFVAILRGVEPSRVVAIAETLQAAGVRQIEVPLTSPDPFASVRALAGQPSLAGCLVGAGTVLTVDEVRTTHAAGGRLVVAPNCDAAVIREALRLSMAVMPGVATATEAFTAIRAGATVLKLFPASSLGPAYLKAIGAVLPPSIRVYPVGGIGAAHIYEWLAAGAAGFGFGSELFKPDYSLEEIGQRARALLAALREARARLGAAPAPRGRSTTTDGGTS
jgi:2-dehydro-3-deoxyphosphogalactonate aldolase